MLVKQELINKMEKVGKYSRDLKRYKMIVNYFQRNDNEEDNRARTYADHNILYLESIKDVLLKNMGQMMNKKGSLYLEYRKLLDKVTYLNIDKSLLSLSQREFLAKLDLIHKKNILEERLN